MNNATTTALPTIFARPAHSGECECVTAPKAYVRTCSRKAKWIIAGRRYCEQHLPETFTKTTGEVGSFKSTTYSVTKKAI
jgi:hypothetical protein